MSLLSRLAKPLVRCLPRAPCWWNGQFLWLPRDLWGAFRVDYEPVLRGALAPALKSAAAFVDVGANLGYWTVWACAVNPGLKAVAIEPSRVAERLRTLLSLNRLSSSVRIVQQCVAAQQGQVRFFDNGETTSSFSQEWTQGWGHPGESVLVTAVTLDEVLAEVRAGIPPDGVIVCKCDIEGAEEEVFESLESAADQRVRFFIELHRYADVRDSAVYRRAQAVGREVTVLGACWGDQPTVMF
jgi:FkbM family methyltransferase